MNKSVIIDDALKGYIQATEGVLDPDLFKAKPIAKPKVNPENPKIEQSIIAVDVKNISPEKKLNIGKPLEFSKSESHSFTEWLKIASFKPIIRDEIEVENEDPEIKEQLAPSEAPLKNKLAIIDKFINENPK